jgi:hypothetical protein
VEAVVEVAKVVQGPLQHQEVVAVAAVEEVQQRQHQEVVAVAAVEEVQQRQHQAVVVEEVHHHLASALLPVEALLGQDGLADQHRLKGQARRPIVLQLFPLVHHKQF